MLPAVGVAMDITFTKDGYIKYFNKTYPESMNCLQLSSQIEEIQADIEKFPVAWQKNAKPYWQNRLLEKKEQYRTINCKSVAPVNKSSLTTTHYIVFGLVSVLFTAVMYKFRK